MEMSCVLREHKYSSKSFSSRHAKSCLSRPGSTSQAYISIAPRHENISTFHKFICTKFVYQSRSIYEEK